MLHNCGHTNQGQFSLTENFGIDPMGVCHGDDLIYLWSPVWNKELPLNNEEIFLREIMTTAWTNFAKFGIPTPPDSGLTPWNPLDESMKVWNISGTFPMMQFSTEIQERMSFWDEIMKG